MTAAPVLPAASTVILAGTVIWGSVVSAGGGRGRGSGDPLAGAPQAELRANIGAIFRDDIAGALTWPFYAATLAALLAVPPALFTGRRLGADAGHHEMTREERAADRA